MGASDVSLPIVDGGTVNEVVPRKDGVSVVICCHNSAARLPETLRHLLAQKTAPDFSWEIVVIDNASSDSTADVAIKCWNGAVIAPLRVVPEPQPGLNRARLRGFAEARYQIVSLIDDDNWIAPDWIATVNEIFLQHPDVAACGGRSTAVPEIDPPGWFAHIQGNYAVGAQHPRNGDITEASGTLLWGAGLSLRIAAFDQLTFHGFEFIVEDRRGLQLSTGGDTEICFALRAAGWRLWYDERLTLEHFVSEERLRWSYALRLMHGMGKASPLFFLYSVALGPSAGIRPTWKQTWIFQFLKSLEACVCTLVLHPLDCLKMPEGSQAALKFKSVTGQVASFWVLRGRFEKLKQQIRQAKWPAAESVR